MKAPPAPVEASFREHQGFLWALCYRMTGVAADADDLVQETFAKAVEAPPRLDAPLKPWLTRVAMNLATDQLRRRRRSPYVGPWLPSPVLTGEQEAAAAVEPRSTEGRYDLLESVCYAFLLALEELSPTQRAVLLLRDVFDYSVREAAEALGLSEANVKTTHLRARKAMAKYDGTRSVPTRDMQERNREALQGLLAALAGADVGAVEKLLAREVTLLSDGGGEFLAARVPILGPARVTTFLRRLTEMRGVPDQVALVMANGFPALFASYDGVLAPTLAPRFLMRVEVDPEGRVCAIHSVLTTRKLTALTATPP